MSLFDKNNDDVKQSIAFFNQLPNKDQITIVSDLNPYTFKLKKYFDQLFPLLSKIQRDIAEHNEIEIGNKLLDLGLDETYARLFVSNVKKHAPTEDYQISQLTKIPDDLFTKQFTTVMYNILSPKKSRKKIVEITNLSDEQINCIEIICKNLHNQLSRGEITKTDIIEKYKDKLSTKKLDGLVNEILKYSPHWYSRLVFANAQDIFFTTNDIHRQNDAILKQLKEIATILKNLKNNNG